MAKRLKTLAKIINERLPKYHAELEQGYHSGDSSIPGTRLRRVGQDYYGNRLIVTIKKGRGKGSTVLDHNSVEPYRTNLEVEAWICEELGKAKGIDDDICFECGHIGWQSAYFGCENKKCSRHKGI